MKTLISILALFISVCGFAQPKLSMSKQYTITPATALSSSVGVPYTGTLSITCRVINRGTTTFSANGLSILRAVNSGTYTSDSSIIHNLPTAPIIIPGDSVTLTVTDTVTATAYRVNGNGNTIVVWPFSPSAITLDSLGTGPIYVSDPTGIEELDRHQLFIYPNPVSQMLYIKPEQGKKYQEIFIYDMQMKLLMRQAFEEGANISGLPPGTYIISVSDHKGTLYSSRFTKNE